MIEEPEEYGWARTLALYFFIAPYAAYCVDWWIGVSRTTWRMARTAAARWRARSRRS